MYETYGGMQTRPRERLGITTLFRGVVFRRSGVDSKVLVGNSAGSLLHGGGGWTRVRQGSKLLARRRRS